MGTKREDKISGAEAALICIFLYISYYYFDVTRDTRKRDEIAWLFYRPTDDCFIFDGP